MSRFKKTLFSAHVTLLLTLVLSVSASAASTSSSIDNAVGAGEGSNPLLAFCYYYAIKNDIEIDFSAFDGAVYRIDGTGDAKSLSNCWLYFVFRMPPHEPDLSFDFAFDFPLTVTRCISQAAYPTSTGFHLSTGYYEFSDSEFGSYNDSSYGDGRAWVRCSSDDFPSYSEYRTIALFVPSGSIDFYSNNSVSGLTLSPSVNTSVFALHSRSGDFTATIKNPAVTAYFSPRTTYWDKTYNLFEVSSTSSGLQYIRLAQNGSSSSYFYKLFGNSPVSVPASSASASGSVNLDAASGYLANPTYSADSAALSGSGNILLFAQLNYTYHNDGGIVDNVAHMTDTLDGMASNLQTITDDFTAREDVGNDIGGTTTDGQISSGASGMSTGSSSLSDGIAGLPSFASIIAPTSGFIGFLTVPIQQIFAFGNGYLLYIATAMVLLSVIFWVVKRMGGDDG